MKVGDMVMFPCDTEQYEPRLGLLIGYHDNPADVADTAYAKNLKKNGRPPRQVADILYKGKMMTCWAQHARDIR